jgi:hypothetical protein
MYGDIKSMVKYSLAALGIGVVSSYVIAGVLSTQDHKIQYRCDGLVQYEKGCSPIRVSLRYSLGVDELEVAAESLGPVLNHEKNNFITEEMRDLKLRKSDLVLPDPDYWIPVPERGECAIAITELRGWPFRCIRSADYALCVPEGWVWETRGSLPLETSLAGVYPPRINSIPLRPYWSGLLLDTLIYGATVGLGTIGAHKLITSSIERRRKEKGLCRKCAYSREGLSGVVACPECGCNPRSRND